MAAPNYFHHTSNPPPPPGLPLPRLHTSNPPPPPGMPLPQPQQLQPPPIYYPYPPPDTYHHHPPPPPQPYYPHYSNPPPPTAIQNNSSSFLDTRDERKTLFIAGLPDDVKAREIYNLFRQFPGFISHQLRDAGPHKAYAFADFADHQSAAAAKQSINGFVFDLQRESALHVDFAKSNSRSKRSRTDQDGAYSPDKKHKGVDAYPRGCHDSGVGTNNHLPGAHNIHGYPSAQSTHTMYDYGTTDPTNLSMSSSSSVPQNSKPCSTLFVANLGPACSQTELLELFSRCPGFTNLKMQKKAGLPVAFVNFEDVASSTGALKYLQGTRLASSLEVGMRIEYAKSPMRQGSRDKKR